MNQEKINKQIFEQLEKLEKVVFKRKEIAEKRKKMNLSQKIDFDIPIRPFMKKYAREMSGPKKFVLLLAFFAKGNLDKEILFLEIKKSWEKMTAKNLLGLKFNRYYSATARENDWVESKKTGLYNLRPSWKNIFKNEY